MLLSVELPPQRPQLHQHLRTTWVIIVLLVIVAAAIYCLVTHGRSITVAPSLLESLLGLF